MTYTDLGKEDKSAFTEWLRKRYGGSCSSYSADDMEKAFYEGIIYENDRIARHGTEEL